MDVRADAALLRAGRRKRGQLARRLCLARDFTRALLLYESQDRAPRLLDWRKRYAMTSDELRAVMQESWAIIEAWSTPRWNEVKLAWFHETGYISDSPRKLTGELTVYRGNLGEPEPTGISWTLSRAEARRFALVAASSRGAFLGMHGEHRTPTVWRATVESSEVLGYFVSRDEDEVVVDPATLRDVQVVERPGAGAGLPSA